MPTRSTRKLTGSLPSCSSSSSPTSIQPVSTGLGKPSSLVCVESSSASIFAERSKRPPLHPETVDNTAVTERLHDLEVIVCELQNEARETQATRLALESQMATSEILFTESQQTIQTLSDQVAHYSALCQSLSDTVTRLLLQVESLTNQVTVLAQNQPPLAAAYTDSSRTVSSVPCS